MSNDHRTSRHRTVCLTASLLLLGCTPKAGLLGELGDSTGGNETETDSSQVTDSTRGDTSGGFETDGQADSEGTPCAADQDADGVPIEDDNAPDIFNPDQSDQDGDTFGDVADLCPSLPSEPNTADSDKDGIGNVCDRCSLSLNVYNAHAAAVDLPTYMRVRNVPITGDADGDGVGDACDNCVVVANCGEWSLDDPHPLGTETPEFGAVCQRDDDQDMVGDACQGMTVTPHASGPIGLSATDDFDQDGLRNEVDGCPRLPLTDPIACTATSECPSGRKCEIDPEADSGWCDHLDRDEDSVGDACDTCSSTPNPMQVVEGEAQVDDQDGDFVGAACEGPQECAEQSNPQPLTYRQVAVQSLCCTVELEIRDEGDLYRITGAPLLDPDGVPIRVDCNTTQQQAGECRALPPSVAARPGVLQPPPGCDAALAAAGLSADGNTALTLVDFEGDPDALQAHACLLPQLDHDFDGLGDACDLCPFSFDPANQPFIDADGTLYPELGAMCNGEYAFDKTCE